MSRKVSTTALFLLSTTIAHSAFAADPYYYSKQNILIGANQVVASANYGKGVVFGDIDTGIVPWVGFSSAYNGQGVDNIDAVNSGVCLNGICTAGIANTDLNGHGTFTASEIVGSVMGGNGNGMTAVAPGGTMVAVQVLNAQGSGTLTDVANGIRYAVDHGAQVLNLSLGPSGSNSQQAAFYSGLASAINYAASKNAYIVFAGGNSNRSLATGITGLSDAALQRLMFVGATDSTKKITSYSNKPGNGSFTSTTGAKTAYKNMWVMAPGGAVNFFGSITDPIWGASNSNTESCAGYMCITQSVGTSMAAPLGTGAIGLLLARWPVLITNGTAAKIIEQTATDLGTKGVDTTYGSGFINLVAAFQPVGGTYAVGSGGQTVTVTSGSGSSGGGIYSFGALGNMPRLASALSNYTTFDGYQRDFQTNLSGLITTNTPTSSASLALTAPKTSVTGVRFTDGSQLAFGKAIDDSPVVLERPEGMPATQNMFVSFTDGAGSTFAAGSGSFPAAASFADAMWGTSNISHQAYNLGASSALLSLAGGGQYLAYGTPVAPGTRVAVAFSETGGDTSFNGIDWTQSDAKSFGTAITQQLARNWTGGLSLNVLGERSGLLGATYDPSGPIHFSDSNRSVSVGVSSAVSLNKSLDLMVDAAIARSDAAKFDGSLISDTSAIYAYSVGASLVQRDTFRQGDGLSLSVRAPLRVYSGSANMAMTSVDAFGTATTGSQRINLTPDGREMNLTASYGAALDRHTSWNISASARTDADNIAGQNEANVLVTTKFTF